MKKEILKKALEKVQAIPIDQAAELLNINTTDINRLIKAGQLEPVSFGGGEISGVLLSSFLCYQEKIVSERVLKSKTYENAKKGFDLFFKHNCKEDTYLQQNLPAFYEIYRRWTDRNGYMTLDKVQLCEYLENICKYESAIVSNERVFTGFSLLGAHHRVDEDVLLEIVLQNYTGLKGTSADILQQINNIVPCENHPAYWPAVPTAMGMWLQRNKDKLKVHGILLRRGKRTSTSRGEFFFEAVK